MDAKVLENIKRATLRVKSILDESEALLRELKSRRARTPDLTLEQQLAPSNEVSDVEVDGHVQQEELELNQEELELDQEELELNQEELELDQEELEQDQGEIEDEQVKPQLEDLHETRDTDSSQNLGNEAYVSSDEEDIPLYRESGWSCCCLRG